MANLILPNPTNHVLPPPPSNPNPSQFHPVPHRSHSNSNPSSNRSRLNSRTIRPCSLCIYKNFDATHYTLSGECGVRKLSSADIIKIIHITRNCPSCGNGHPIIHQCKTTFPDS